MLRNARLTDLIMVDGTVLQLHQILPIRYMNSELPLERPNYRWSGELPSEQIGKQDKAVTIATFAYRCRHQADGTIKRFRTGTFRGNNENVHLNILGVIRQDRLLVVTEPSSRKHRDVAPMQPVRIAGLSAALKFVRKRFSSPELNLNLDK